MTSWNGGTNHYPLRELSHHQSVTDNAIPLRCTRAAYERLEMRPAFAEIIEEQCQEFLEAEQRMQFMHVESVRDTQTSLFRLIQACKAYERNLGWDRMY